MAKANGKKIIKKTGLIMAVILAVTGVASLLAWGFACARFGSRAKFEIFLG